MSRLTGADAYGLMEAYNAVYAPQELTEEQVWEEVETWVNSLVEEGYDLSDYTWEEMYESYLEEIYGTNLGGNVKTKPNKLDTAVSNVVKSITSSGADATPRTTGIYGQPTRKPAPAAKPAAPAPAAARPATPAPAAAKPTAPAAAKVAPTKPTPAAQTGDKTKDMATFAKANPNLAASAAEKARIRGTQQTDNPLMKSMRSRLPMNSPSVQAPAVSNLGKGNQSLSQNPNAFKAAPPKPVATSTAPEVKATNTAAATPKPTPVAPKAPTGGPKTRAQVLGQSFDPFDVVMGHLLDEGYADTEEAALKIMANMSEEWRQDIMEISQKTATTVYGIRRSSEFDGDDGPDRIKNTNKLRDRIGKKFGDEAVKNADAHADSQTFGRTDSRTGKRQERPQSRTQRPNKYRTRADGKMHGQDQNTLKAKLQKRRPSDSDN